MFTRHILRHSGIQEWEKKIKNIANLACPIDGKRLISDEKQFGCENGHVFDIARQGYVNLLPVQFKRSKYPGDSKEMVCARTEFLNTTLYEPIAERLAELIALKLKDNKDMRLFDAGCGEGYYLDYIQQTLHEADTSVHLSCIGLDISKPAIIAATKRNKTIQWVVGTNRQPPVEDNSIDTILCVFGFQSFEGFNKILTLDGTVILVEAGPNHLQELRALIYDEVKKSEIRSITPDEYKGFIITDSETLKFNISLENNQQINNLLLMTPHLFRATRQGKAVANQLQTLDLTVDVVFHILERAVTADE